MGSSAITRVWEIILETAAVLLKGPRDLDMDTLALHAPGPSDLVVNVTHSGISTGTEKTILVR